MTIQFIGIVLIVLIGLTYTSCRLERLHQDTYNEITELTEQIRSKILKEEE